MFAAAAALVVMRCASNTATVAPATPLRAEDRFLVDPRIGYTVSVTPAVGKRFIGALQLSERGTPFVDKELKK